MLKLLALALSLVFMVTVAVPALAAGPYDGFWFVIESHPTQGVTTYYVSIHQNDANLTVYGYNVLITSFRIGGGARRIGAGILSGNQASGNLFDQNIAFLGTIQVTFTDSTHFTGAAASALFGTSTLFGERVF